MHGILLIILCNEIGQILTMDRVLPTPQSLRVFAGLHHRVVLALIIYTKCAACTSCLFSFININILYRRHGHIIQKETLYVTKTTNFGVYVARKYVTVY